MTKQKAKVSVVPQGPAFKKWCEAQGYTVLFISRTLGVSTRTVFRWQAGDVKVSRATWIALGGV